MSELVTIFISRNKVASQLIKHKLDEANIPNFSVHENMSEVLPFAGNENEIRVPSNFVAQAKQIIDNLDVEKLEYEIINNTTDTVKIEQKYFGQAILIFVIVLSLLISYSYFKMF